MLLSSSSFWLLLLTVASGVNAALQEFKSFDFVARTYLAAGYINETAGGSPGKPDLFGFGLGAVEQAAYDDKEMLLYAASERGVITLIDYSKGPAMAEQIDFTIQFDINSVTLTDVDVCGDFLFVASKDDPNNGTVSIYATAKRGADGGAIANPTLITSVTVGVGPDMIYPNPTCDILGVANEGEGNYDDGLLVDPQGSVTLIKGPFDDADLMQVVHVSLNHWTDDELIAKGVHLPLPLNALEYWDDYADIDVNFGAARANYEPASNLEPEYLAWAADGATLYVNLQENSALVVVDVESGTATDIFSYGLKDWSTTGIDVVEDGGFTSVKVEGLYTTRSPDSIVSYTVDDETYIVTANEGDDKEYGDFEERVKAKTIFMGSDLPRNVTADLSVFDPSDITKGTSQYFNKECDETLTAFCSPSMRVTVGTSMMNFSNPAAPHIERFVGMGGRGVSIYKVTPTALTLVWDSADEFEVAGAKAYPWAHNGVQDEEFASVNGIAYNLANDDLQETMREVSDPDKDGCVDQGDGTPGACPLGQTVDERSLKDGPAAEAVVVGEACGSRFMVTVTEKNSIGFLYNIDMSPKLVKVFHLSEVSETLSPGLAYEARTLGEIDSESIIFLDAAKSPTGKAAVIFAGAWSGTLSYWEFSCEAGGVMDTPAPTPTTSTIGEIGELPTTPGPTPQLKAGSFTPAPTTTTSGGAGKKSMVALMMVSATIVALL